MLKAMALVMCFRFREKIILTGKTEEQTTETSMMVWMLEGSGHEAHSSPCFSIFLLFFLLLSVSHVHNVSPPPSLPFHVRHPNLSHSLAHTAWCTPPFFSTWGSEGGQERRTKANWNAPVSAFLTWCMAHEMQPSPAVALWTKALSR